MHRDPYALKRDEACNPLCHGDIHIDLLYAIPDVSETALLEAMRHEFAPHLEILAIKRQAEAPTHEAYEPYTARDYQQCTEAWRVTYRIKDAPA